ncbi:YbjN domain-containing protein [Pikeienuella piscinae]|uniref:YbjN domain-containing protein n=1 Tax=Pikeienuella piscinae TaxID=2748098 RepID=A0A7L5BZI0_9RHOB|nr:YbjN domain-containing protein [Pikeienuella piscinae]QIE56238.1 YbjN domain-containing protein [Pikeienuella piscinae]
MKTKSLSVFPACALAFAAGLWSAPAASASTVLTSISPQTLEALLEAEGAMLTQVTTGGDTTLRSEPLQIGPSDVKPIAFEVFFYECDGGDFIDPAGPGSACLSFEYRALAPSLVPGEDAEIANRWNEIYHFGKAWRDELGEVALQMSVVVDGGVTEENIRATYRRWRITLAAFAEYLDME